MTVHMHPRAMEAPPAAVMRVLERFDRGALEGFIAVAIDLLDTIGGDPEAEEIPVEDAQLTYEPGFEDDATDPDYEDGTDLEDDFALTPRAELSGEGVPGCPVSDAADPSWTEWQTRGRRKLRLDQFEPADTMRHEDDEEDDPSGQCDEDGINTALFVKHATTPGCTISDSDLEHDGREEERCP